MASEEEIIYELLHFFPFSGIVYWITEKNYLCYL
jgi:hypothetical protein